MWKTKEFYDKAFKGVDVPPDLRRASERVCNAYNINGICDPMYIANVIAMEIGRGDGQSNFHPEEKR